MALKLQNIDDCVGFQFSLRATKNNSEGRLQSPTNKSETARDAMKTFVVGRKSKARRTNRVANYALHCSENVIYGMKIT